MLEAVGRTLVRKKLWYKTILRLTTDRRGLKAFSGILLGGNNSEIHFELQILKYKF